MTKRKGLRMLPLIVLFAMLSCGFASPAYAYADDTEQALPITEATKPEEVTEEPPVSATPAPDAEAFDGEGNAYTRDLLYDKATNKQFITVQSKSGNTFYIVIDYDAPINEEEEQYQTYFLNLVDETDLMSLLDDETAAELTTCVCTDKCEAGDVNTECPVCKNNMSECTGAAPVPDENDSEELSEAEPEKTESSVNIGMIIAVVAIIGIGGAAYYYFKFIRSKKETEEDLDFFDDEDYEEEPYVNEGEVTETDTSDEDEEETEEKQE